MDVLIDTDPGGDDAIAIMWLASLAHQGRIHLAAVTTAAGNVPAGMTFANARGLLALCGLGAVPVARGADKEGRRDAAHIHGQDGLGGLAHTLPAAAITGVRPTSVQLLRDLLSRPGARLRVLAVAPLHNLAEVERQCPGTLARAAEVVVMGGALGEGNVTPRAEFNFFFDPQAAATVLSCGANIRLVTLDTSLGIRLDRAAAAAAASGCENAAAGRFFVALCRFMRRREALRSGDGDSFPVHDAATVAWMAYPELFTASMRRLAVHTADGADRGRLVPCEDGTGMCVTACHANVDALVRHLVRDLHWLMVRLADSEGFQTPK